MEGKIEPEASVEKAIAALGKAYSIYQLPIYLYDLACCFEMNAMPSQAEDLFAKFLQRMHGYKPDQLDTIMLGDRDFGAAVADAEARLRGKRK